VFAGPLGASGTAHMVSFVDPNVTRSVKRPPEVLSDAEAIALMRACSSRAPTGIGNRALIAVLWRCGLRISEALGLELRDVDLQAGTVRVRHGEGDRSRTVGLDEPTAALLARWLDRRRALGPGPRAPIFCTLAGGAIDTSYVRRLLPRLAARAGITRRVHAHGLRHTYASELAREHTPIPDQRHPRRARTQHPRRHRPLPARRRPDARHRDDAGTLLERRADVALPVTKKDSTLSGCQRARVS